MRRRNLAGLHGDYAPAPDRTVKTLFVTNWDLINSNYGGITASNTISNALSNILTDTDVMGTVIDLSNLDTVTNTAIVNNVYSLWDDDLSNPFMSAGSEGTTILRPGAARNCEYTTSEC